MKPIHFSQKKVLCPCRSTRLIRTPTRALHETYTFQLKKRYCTPAVARVLHEPLQKPSMKHIHFSQKKVRYPCRSTRLIRTPTRALHETYTFQPKEGTVPLS